jgi:hypothetical protein
MLTTTLSHVEWVGGSSHGSSQHDPELTECSESRLVASPIEPPLQPKADPSETLWRKKYAGMTDFDR